MNVSTVFSRTLILVIIALANYSSFGQTTNFNLDSLLTQSKEALSSGDPEKAKLILLEGLQSYQNITDTLAVLHQIQLQSELVRLGLQHNMYPLVLSQEKAFRTITKHIKTQNQKSEAARLLNNIGIGYRRNNQNQQAVSCFLKAIEWQNQLENPNLFFTGSILNNAGFAMIQTADFNRAIKYLEQSLRSLNHFIDKNSSSPNLSQSLFFKGDAMNNMAIAYQKMLDHSMALIYFDSIFDNQLYNESTSGARLRLNKAISLIELDRNDEAEVILREILKADGTQQTNPRVWIQANINLSDILTDRDPASIESKVILQKSIDILIMDLEAYKDLYWDIILLKCQQLVQNSDFQQAQNTLIEAMEKVFLVRSFEKLIQEVIPVCSDGEKLMILDAISLHAELLARWGRSDGSIDKLDYSFQEFQHSTLLYNHLLTNFTTQTSKIEVSRTQRRTYNRMVDLGYELFQKTGNLEYIDQVFSCFEGGKAAGLWNIIQANSIIESSVTDEIRMAKKSIDDSISYYQAKIHEQRNASKPSPDLIKTLSDKLFLQSVYSDTLMNFLRLHYEDFYLKRFDRSTITLTDVRKKLKPEDLMLQYYFTEDFLYVFRISQSESAIHRIPLEDDFFSMAENLLDYVRGEDGSFTADAMSKFTVNGHQLYKMLIGETLKGSSPTNLILIPDGILSYLPFEILLTDTNGHDLTDHRSMPYAFIKHHFTYGYTATLYYNPQSKERNPKQRLLAMAPSYSPDESDINISAAVRQLPHLTGTIEEVKKIRQLVSGKALVNHAASEYAFKRMAGRFQVLHLAMHTILDTVDPQNSSLVFSPGVDEEEDGLLYAHELYNMKLNADLVVLSACDTGTGQWLAGEGILSIARGFAFSGSSNLVMTLWKIEDKAGKMLMEQFYKELRSKVSISEALRTSRKVYLENANSYFSHPQFWSGFIQLGPDQTLNLSPCKRNTIYILALAVIIIGSVLLGISMWKKRKTRFQ